MASYILVLVAAGWAWGRWFGREPVIGARVSRRLAG